MNTVKTLGQCIGITSPDSQTQGPHIPSSLLDACAAIIHVPSYAITADDGLLLECSAAPCA